MSLPAPIFVGTCVNLRAPDLHRFDDSSRQVQYRTARQLLRGKLTRWALDMGYERSSRTGLTLQDDWAVRYLTGQWRGRRAVCVMHSSIHHIWLV